MNKFPRLLCLVLALCTAWPVFAETKSQQVERYLGTFRYENDRPRGTIKFIFQKAVLKRNGTGKKTYQYLLFNEPFFSNEDNAGRLIGIQIVNNGKTSTIRPESPEAPASVAEPAAPAVRVNVPNDPIRPQQGGGFNVGSMLDSSKVAGNMRMLPAARATRCVSALLATSTMCAWARTSKCVSGPGVVLDGVLAVGLGVGTALMYGSRRFTFASMALSS